MPAATVPDSVPGSSPFVSASTAIEELARGRFVVVADSEDPAADADVMIAAEFASVEAINFLAAEARGVIYLGLSDERCREMRLGPMAEHSDPDSWKSAFMVMIDAREGISTGISAADRARAVAVAIDPGSEADDLVRPGHIVPLRAQPGGVLVRTGRTEAFVDLPRMAGLVPAGAASSVLTEEGAVATVADLRPWCERHGIRMVTIDAVAAEGVLRLPWLERSERERLRTPYGDLDTVVLVDPRSRAEHAVVVGRLPEGAPARVAVFGQCTVGHVLGDDRCGDRVPFEDALRSVADGRTDLVVHVGLPGLCCQGPGTWAGAPGCATPASESPWAIVAKALHDLGVSAVAPAQASPRGWQELTRYGIAVAATDADGGVRAV
jgi:3,4-dihydroxy 2-butanone 4-phosphate synthase/GTP cyclohydrolase II